MSIVEKKGVLLCFLIGVLLIEIVSAGTGDITEVRILQNGWMAEIDIEGFLPNGTYNFGLGENNTLNNPQIIFNVVSEGYNSSGSLGTINRTVYGTSWIRQPYPNQNFKNETQTGNNITLLVALSDFIYNDDKNGGAGTSGTDVTVSIGSNFYYNNYTGGTETYNNEVVNMSVVSQSTLDYPKVIGRWAWPGYERVTEDFLVEAVAFHRFAQYGKPIAAINFLATDQSGHSTESIVTDMTISSRSDSDANKVLVYATTVSLDNFNPNEIINVTFVAYPWLGDEDSVLNSSVGADGFEQPDERLGPLYTLNDKDESYGIGYALVSNSGSDGTGTVYSTQVAAENGSAFLTIENAAEAIRTYHNSNYGRDNAGGGVILLAEGNYSFPGDTPANLGASMDTWLIIRPSSNARRSNTTIAGGTNVQFQAIKLKIEGINLTASAGINTIRGRTASDSLWLHNNTINLVQTAPIYSFKTAYATQNSVLALSGGFGAFSTTKTPYAIIRGNTAKTISSTSINGNLYSFLGNKNIGALTATLESAAGHQISDNVIYAFNSVYSYSLTISILGAAAQNGNVSHGMAIIQNVIEKNESVAPLLQIAADSSKAIANNILLWKNTFAGQRENLGYNDNGNESYDRLNWNSRFNIFDNWNNKDDTFGPLFSSNRTGSWPVGYNVGSVGNSFRSFTFRGEFDGLFSLIGYNASFVDDNSYSTGDASGNGNYTLNSNSTLIDIINQNVSDPSFYWVLPYDFNGNPIYDSADAGAYEFQPPFSMAKNPLNLSSTIRIYGDEKWKIKTLVADEILSNLTISLPGDDTSKWVDIVISEWDSTGNMTWMESSEISVNNVSHSIGGLTYGTNYLVKLDNITGKNISGQDCSSGVCKANSSGYISFYYTGGYSAHTFVVSKQDTPEEQNFSVQKPVTSGGSYSYPYFMPSQTQLQEGYSKILFKNWRVKFTFEDEAHELRVDEIYNNSATFTISSNPHRVTISVNETKKINLNSDNYNDLLIRLDNVISSGGSKSVNIFIQSIQEEIFENNKSSASENLKEQDIKIEKNLWERYLAFIALALALIGLIFVLLKITNHYPFL